MHAVSDRMNRIAREETLRDLAMFHRDAVDVSRPAERQIGHIQSHLLTAALQGFPDRVTQHRARQVSRKLIVSGRDRGMGRKDTLVAHTTKRRDLSSTP